jgi:hypothetical protein
VCFMVFASAGFYYATAGPEPKVNSCQRRVKRQETGARMSGIGFSN